MADFVWATWIPRHRPLYGLIHGTLLFLCIGLFLGTLAKKQVLGAIAGALIGFLAAGSFYLLAPLAGYSIMFGVWFAVWIALGLFNERLHGRQAPVRAAVVRGLLAAAGSGVAFYLSPASGFRSILAAGITSRISPAGPWPTSPDLRLS